MSTDTITDDVTLTDIIPYEDTKDGKDHKTHIVSPPENKHLFQIGMSAQDIVDLARATGQQVIALCGYRWVPKRNPEKYDVCQECFAMASSFMQGAGE